VEEVELRASGFEKEEPSGLTDGGEPGPKNEKRGVPGSVMPGTISFKVAGGDGKELNSKTWPNGR